VTQSPEAGMTIRTATINNALNNKPRDLKQHQ
jgi:hypothetical protein